MSKATLLAADEAEASVLAAVLMRDDAIDDVRHVLDPDDFRVPAYRAVYEAMLVLCHEGYPIDYLHIERRMTAADTIGLVGGIAGLDKIGGASPQSHLVLQHAELVLDAARRRAMRMAALELAEAAATDERKTDDIVAEHLRGADRLLSGDMSQLVHAGAAMQIAADQVELTVKTGKLPRMPTPLVRLNDHLGGGWWPSWYVLIAAAEKMGKSAFALACSRCATKLDHPVLYFSGEMPAIDQGARLITSEADVLADELRRVEGPNMIQWVAINQAIRDMRGRDFHFAAGTFDMDRIASLWRAWSRKRKGKHGLVVVDYLQLARRARGRNETRADELAALSGGLKEIANETGDTVLVLLQLDTKTIDNREGHVPRLSDARETQATSKDLDLGIVLTRPWVYDRKKRSDLTEIRIPRARHVAWPWKMSAVFDGRTMAFGDRYDEDEQGEDDEPSTEKPRGRSKRPYAAHGGDTHVPDHER